MLASAEKSPRTMMVSTPVSEMTMPASCAQVRRTPNSSSDHSATNRGPDDWINNAFSAWVYCSAQYDKALLMANPVADSTTSGGSRARNAGQSRLRCGQANGSSMRNAPIHLTHDSVNGGTWPATWRASTILPAQNSAVRLNNR